MSTVFVDTHQIITTLKQRGFSEDQATGVAQVIQEIDLDQLVTKQDLKAELATLKAELFKWSVPILLAQSALIVALVELLG